MESAQVPGFRPGRAPRKLIEARFRKDVGEQVKKLTAIETYDLMVEAAWGETIPFRQDQIRRVTVTGVCDTLVLLLRRTEDRTWECEDIRTGRGRLVDERYMENELFNDMEVIAWASQ